MFHRKTFHRKWRQKKRIFGWPANNQLAPAESTQTHRNMASQSGQCPQIFSIIFSKILKRLASLARLEWSPVKRSEFAFDPRTGRLQVGGLTSILRPKTAAVLAALTSEPDRIHSKEDLLDDIWRGIHVHDQAIFQCINEIRSAFQTNECVRTHARLGYQWIGPPGRKAHRFGTHPRLFRLAIFSVLIFAMIATLSFSSAAPSNSTIRIAVLPAATPATPLPRDAGLSFGLMEMIDERIGMLRDVETIPARDVLRAIDRQPSPSASTVDGVLDADIIVHVAVERQGELLSAKFTIEGKAGHVEGTYDSASSAWLAQQIAYEVSDAVRYSLVPEVDVAARIDRHHALIAAKRLLYDFRGDLALPTIANIAADDPAYLTARYYAISTRSELDMTKTSDDIAQVLAVSRASGDRLNETRALLLSARKAWRGGDRADAAAAAKAGRMLAARDGFDSIDAAFDFGDGVAFASYGEFNRAAAAFRRAEMRYLAADCIVGLVTTYSHLSRALLAANQLPEARAASARIKALQLISPQTVSRALAAARSS